MNGWVDRRKEGRKDGIDRRVDAWINGKLVGWLDRQRGRLTDG